jgi:YD repeat-containing protein
MVDPEGTGNFTYDRADRIAWEHGPLATADYTGYDAADNVKDVTVPSGSFHYGWRADNQLSTRTAGATTTLSYDSAGRSSGLTAESAQVDEIDRSWGGRPTAVRFRQAATATPYLSNAITYDAAGRSTLVTDNVAGTIRNAFNYDRDGNLTQDRHLIDTGLEIVDYQYDVAGNRTQRVGTAGTTTYTYDKASRITTSVTNGTTTTYTYDGAGNLVSASAGPLQNTTYQWGSDARLLKVVPLQGGTTSTVTFTYDADGRLAKEQSADGLLSYRYDGDELEAILDSLGQELMHFGYDDRGVPFSITVKKITGDKIFYFHFGADGSVERLTDSSGSMAARYSFGAFGDHVEEEHGPAWDIALNRNPSRYRAGAGWRWLGSPVGLYVAGGSYYDPSLARPIDGSPEARYPIEQPRQKCVFEFVDGNYSSPIDVSRGDRRIWCDFSGLGYDPWAGYWAARQKEEESEKQREEAKRKARDHRLRERVVRYRGSSRFGDESSEYCILG